MGYPDREAMIAEEAAYYAGRVAAKGLTLSNAEARIMLRLARMELRDVLVGDPNRSASFIPNDPEKYVEELRMLVGKLTYEVRRSSKSDSSP